MTYKDKEKQREATRRAVKRLRDKRKGITEKDVIPDKNVIPTSVIPVKDVIPDVIPKIVKFDPGKVKVVQQRMQDYYDTSRKRA